jgi:hypothetical protein
MGKQRPSNSQQAQSDVRDQIDHLACVQAIMAILERDVDDASIDALMSPGYALPTIWPPPTRRDR